MNKQSKSIRLFWLRSAPLFVAVFIDGAGMGLFFPLLNALIIDPQHSVLPATVSVAHRNFFYGCTVSLYMFAFFIGSAVLGDLSDYIGRRKVLCICLAGTFIGYLLAAVSVVVDSFALLIISRVIAGFTAGSQPIVQAAIVDLSASGERTKNLGRVLLAAAFGFIVGPVLGGVLSDSRLVSWFEFTTPFYFVALLALFSLVFVMRFMEETTISDHKTRVAVRWLYAFNLFAQAFKTAAIRQLSIILLLFIIGWSSYISYIAMFLWHYYHYSPMVIGLFWSALAVGYAFGFGYLVGKLQGFASHRVLLVGFIVASVGILLTVVLRFIFSAWWVVLPLGALNGVTYTILLSLFSHQVDDKQQGWVMGVTGSVLALGFAMATFFGGILVNLGVSIPILFAAAVYGIGALLIMRHRPGKPSPQSPAQSVNG